MGEFREIATVEKAVQDAAARTCVSTYLQFRKLYPLIEGLEKPQVHRATWVGLLSGVPGAFLKEPCSATLARGRPHRGTIQADVVPNPGEPSHTLERHEYVHLVLRVCMHACMQLCM